MNDVIRLLPDSVANQIAAGEVIQRPASVIKELVENAVDAGATDIKIYIKDAGRTLIQVVDNGCGMSDTDARMAFERHATSKITRADDLFSLHTMGFRGEALPSICAISQIDLRSRRRDDPVGTQLLINGSKVECQQPYVCECGTSISVKNLFFNVPARRKFLKSDNVELSNVMREFERLALVNNHIRMSIDTGTRQLDLRAATLRQRIHDIWRNNLKMQLLPVDVDTELARIHGYVSRPEFARRRNALQFLIVNGRNMRHPYFHKAVLSCFEGLIASDTQPCYFLKFEVDPSTIDVNIHPTKNEIKFEHEHEIWPLLVAGVKASLGKNSAVPSINFDDEALPAAPAHPGDALEERPDVEMPEGYNPFAMHADDDFGMPGFTGHYASGTWNEGNARNWDKLYGDFIGRGKSAVDDDYYSNGPDTGTVEAGAVIPGLGAEDGSFRLPCQSCLQFALKYIITTVRGGVLLIDQHRAHVRILYERILAGADRGEAVSQRVLFPETLALDPEQREALGEVGEDLRRLGFILEPTPPEQPCDAPDTTHWLLTGIPSEGAGNDPRDTVMRIIDSVLEDSHNYGSDPEPAESILRRMSLVMARSSAITRGRRLSGEEMDQLVSDLFATSDPSFTPSGNRIYVQLDEPSLAGMF